MSRIHRDDCAAVRKPLAVIVREPNPVLERALGRALERDVDRQLDALARLALLADDRLRPGDGPPERVDVHLVDLRLAAQVGVVRALDTGLADLVAGRIPVLPQLLQLVGRDLADVAEHVGEQGLRVVLAQVGEARVHARELAAVLRQVVELRLVYRDLDGHRGQRVVLPLLELGEDPGERHVDDPGELLHLRVATLLRQIGRPHLDGGRADVRDEHAALAVDDRAARRLAADGAELVVQRRVLVPRAGEDLERPQAEEEHGEDRERDRGEDRHPKRHPRVEEVGLFDAGVARKEAAGAAGGRVTGQGRGSAGRARGGRAAAGSGSRACRPAR